MPLQLGKQEKYPCSILLFETHTLGKKHSEKIIE